MERNKLRSTEIFSKLGDVGVSLELDEDLPRHRGFDVLALVGERHLKLDNTGVDRVGRHDRLAQEVILESVSAPDLKSPQNIEPSLSPRLKNRA